MCVGHMGTGEFTIHFCPRDHFTCMKSECPLMPKGWGGRSPGVSNDWSIAGKTKRKFLLILAILHGKEKAFR